MLRSTNDLLGFAVSATDGPIGHVRDFYFDDQKWVVRYLVVETGDWILGREVLISPIAVGQVNGPQKRLPVSITKEQVKNSPDIDTQKPVSRQHEQEYFGYYGYPYYWGGLGLWGDGLYPYMMLPNYADSESSDADQPNGKNDGTRTAAGKKHEDPHLRSCRAVVNYHIHATDGDIGHVHGFLIDEKTWAIRYAIVNTSNWWLGHEMLIAPQWIEDVSWEKGTVAVDLTRQAVKDAPAYDSSAKLDRSHEIDIHRHYGRRGYWADEVNRKRETSHV